MRASRYAIVLFCLAIVGVAGSQASRASDASDDAQCRPFFHDACSDALGRWLPHLDADWGAFWDHGLTTKTAVRDDFSKTSSPGTFFVYGDAGPPKGHVFYDAAHRLALYRQGCCAWGETVLASDVAPPPKSVAARDLAGLSTEHGIRLGATPAEVRSVYGAAPLEPTTPGHPDVEALAYSTLVAKKDLPKVGNACGQFDSFYFRRGRLVQIQLANAC